MLGYTGGGGAIGADRPQHIDHPDRNQDTLIIAVCQANSLVQSVSRMDQKGPTGCFASAAAALACSAGRSSPPRWAWRRCRCWCWQRHR